MKKDLEKMYAEYQKIQADKKAPKKQEIPHNQNNLKSLKNAFDKFMAEEAGVQHFDDGGSVQPDDDSGIFEFLKSVRKSLGTPESKQPINPKESLEDKYARIRQQNNERALGQRPMMNDDSDPQVRKDMGLNQGGRVQYYADGTDDVQPVDPVTGNVDPNSPEGLEMIKNHDYDELIQNPTSDSMNHEQVNGDEVDINANLRKPADLKDVEEQDDVDKAAIEKPYATEELEEELKSDEKSKDDNSKEDQPKDDEDQRISDELKSELDKEESKNVSSDNKDQGSQSVDSQDQPEQQNSNISNNLSDAQNKRALLNGLTDIAEGGTMMGHGLARSDASESLKALENSRKNANIPVQNYQEQIANQVNDPNSDISQVARQYLASKNIKTSNNTTAATIFKVSPMYLKDAGFQNAIQRVLLQGKIKQGIVDQQQAGADKRANAKNKIEQQKADALIKNAQNNVQTKQDNNKDKALMQTQTLLESARGNPAAAQAEKDLYSTQKVDSLINSYPNLNKIPDAQVNLLVSEINKIATGGVPTGHEQEALKPNTPESRLNKLWGQLTNAPTGANAGAYLKEFQKYNATLAKDAQKVIHDKYGRVIESRKKQLGDENYKSLQDQYMNRFGGNDSAPPIDADLTKMNADQLKAYIQTHGKQ